MDESYNIPRKRISLLFLLTRGVSHPCSCSIHVHVVSGDGEAKFRFEADLELAKNYGYNRQQLKEIESLVEDHRNELVSAWKQHFGS
ncbi:MULTISPECIES: DUF4160 domain-containing protein [Halomonadaceae]|uniref:DUF4160 domain-containing protein n=1 Tax=Halomonadaceae TaxID=28256 RepID=UPI001916F36E|nr:MULTISPECIES: DUF4160 domain-containing protein [Halomonas]MCD6008704.1 DUF4160 domain-containing protein [Halomonas sp. IOP_31]